MGDILHTLGRRYGAVEPDLNWGRLVMKQNRNQARLDVIDELMAELSQERRRLKTEDLRIELTKRILVEDTADRIRLREGEGWSPTPVAGYRVWQIADDTVMGATGHPWPEPVMTARCSQSRPDDDLPHTDHLCSSVGHGCGIYAAVDVRLVAPPANTAWIVGIVQMSGKVVEHEHGYRAARARVVAAVAHSNHHVLITNDDAVIHALFEKPGKTVAELGEPSRTALHGTGLIEVIEDLERQMEAWT